MRCVVDEVSVESEVAQIEVAKSDRRKSEGRLV